jgi:hypothetical protein
MMYSKTVIVYFYVCIFGSSDNSVKSLLIDLNLSETKEYISQKV